MSKPFASELRVGPSHGNSAELLFVGLGGNRERSLQTFARARELITAHREIRLLGTSSLYRTDPWGGQTVEPFTNAVIALGTTTDPHHVLDILMAVEHALGRRRENETRWGSRTLDLDLLAQGDWQVSRPGLQIPHPRAYLRKFVLVPWAELAADFEVPGTGKTVGALLEACPDDSRVELLDTTL